MSLSDPYSYSNGCIIIYTAFACPVYHFRGYTAHNFESFKVFCIHLAKSPKIPAVVYAKKRCYIAFVFLGSLLK